MPWGVGPTAAATQTARPSILAAYDRRIDQQFLPIEGRAKRTRKHSGFPAFEFFPDLRVSHS